jgi:membrane protein YqaA with SNARE-associated domain
VLGWCCVSAGVAFGSALIPLISVEIFVLGLVAREPGLPWLAIGAAVAVGQVAGKLPYYLAARGSLHLPAFLHRTPRTDREPSERRDRWRQRTKRLRGWIEALTERCHRHPHWMFATYGVSSVVGLPPFMATTVLAGLARMSPAAFVSAGLAGRFVRFSILAASPALIAHFML